MDVDTFESDLFPIALIYKNSGDLLRKLNGLYKLIPMNFRNKSPLFL